MTTIAEKTQRATTHTYVIEVTEAFEYVDNGFETASWCDVYEIQPGRYEVEWTNSNGTPWNPDPEAVTHGYIANIGPYYAKAHLDAILRRTHRVNRLLTESRAVDTHPDEPTTHTWSTYAYNVKDGEPAITRWIDGKRVVQAVYRATPIEETTR